jgi:ubiquitin carboxyl-terminal hydrolase 1
MSSWQQQDAQEYFSKVMDEVDKETRLAVRSYEKEALLDPHSFEIEKDVCAKDSGPKLQLSETDGPLQNAVSLRNPLEGLIAQRVGCIRCGHSDGLSLIPFNCLTVPLGKDFYYDIRECLDEYTALESIEGVECAKCTLLSSQAKLLSMMEPNYDSDISSQPTTLQALFRARLDDINEALEEDDFSDNTLTKKCKIAAGSKVSTTKSRQAVIARPPQSLILHVNRSLFDEHTGVLAKNYANIKFQKTLDLGSWCLGSKSGVERAEADDILEEWVMDPTQSLLANKPDTSGPQYEIRAVIIHQGRHENGHYICYRKQALPALPTSNDSKAPAIKSPERWWRMSDDDVDVASPEEVFSQGGVFMLFYERIPNGDNLAHGSTPPTATLPAKLDPIKDEDPSTTIRPPSETAEEEKEQQEERAEEEEQSHDIEQSDSDSSTALNRPEPSPSLIVQQKIPPPPASQTGFRNKVENAESREHVASPSSSPMVTAN